MAYETIYDRKNLQPGTYTSPSRAVLPGTREINLRAILDAADLADATLRIRYAIEASYDPQGLTWRGLNGGLWHGGILDDRTGQFVPPQYHWAASESDNPTFLRAIVDIPKRLSVRVELEVL